MPTIVRKKKPDVSGRAKARSDCRCCDAEAVHAAVQSLDQGVQNLIWGYKRRMCKRFNAAEDHLPEAEMRRIATVGQRIAAVLAHVRHCFTELRKKLHSLQAGLDCYTTKLLPSFQQHIIQFTKTSSSKHDLISSLQHLFQCLLRLHDGYILTVSGECRHRADVEMARSTAPKYRSRLNQVADDDTIRDGPSLAILYAAENTYSGTAWDEWNDCHKGLRVRLLALLKPLVPANQRETIWDDWTEPGQPAFQLESIVGQTEDQQKMIQLQFTDLTKSKLVTAVRSAILQKSLQVVGGSTAVTVNLHWKDKMEQLHVVSAPTGKVQLERFAGDFQICKSMSALPAAHRTSQQWWEHGGMKWSTATNDDNQNEVKASQSHSKEQTEVPSKKARRKIIVDSDSDDYLDAKPAAKSVHKTSEKENKQQQPPSAATGLVVKVVDSRKKESSVELSSVNEIKMKFGVDIEEMQAAFDGLQAEEADAMRVADLVDNDPLAMDDHRDELYDIHQAERHVKRKKRALLRVLDNLNYDDADTAIWNAREILREALMRAGDVMLWSDTAKSNDVATARGVLQKAIQHFTDAKGQVVAQQRLHERMNSSMKDLGEDTRFFRRNLLLLKGQAQTNTGIATVELALHEPDRMRKTHLLSACKELDAAVASTNAMKSRAKEDAVSATSNIQRETTLDLLRAQQLESLALRWKASALWHLYNKQESFEAFRTAAAVYQAPRLSSKTMDVDIQDAALECRVECYNAWTTLADLASQSMDHATVTMIRESDPAFDKLLDYVTQALMNASSMSKAIQAEVLSTPEKYDSMCDEGSLLTAENLLQSLKDIQIWWTRRKAAATQRIIMEETVKSALPSLPRNDLLSDGRPRSTEPLPTQRFTAQPQPRRRRSKYNLGGVGYNNIGTSVGAYPGEQIDTPRETKKYREWREDMIFDKTTGKMVPKLVYPSVAPEMPPHIAAILAARMQCSSHRFATS